MAYMVECPSCKQELMVSPSLFMTTGMANMGGGVCFSCNVRLRFEMQGETWGTAEMVAHIETDDVEKNAVERRD